MASFFKSCFRPCLGDDSAARQAPRDVTQKTPTPGPGEAPPTRREKAFTAKKGLSWADFLDRYRKGDIDPADLTERPADMPEDEKFLKASMPPNEKERQLALYKYNFMQEPLYHEGQPPEGVEHTSQSDTLFRIVNLARETFKVNVALISLLDDDCQYFKSEVGLESVGMRDLAQVPRDISFCGHTILNRAPLVILDASKDWRMANNPLVVNPPGVRFYAGVPIIAPEGYALGTLCLLDLTARTEFHGGAKLQEFSALAMQEIRSLYEQNQKAKITKMNDVLATFPEPNHVRTGSTKVASALELEEQRLRMRQAFTPEQQQAVFKAGRNQGLKVVAKTGDLNSAAAEREALQTNNLATQILPSPTVLAPQGDHMLGRPLGEEEPAAAAAVTPAAAAAVTPAAAAVTPAAAAAPPAREQVTQHQPAQTERLQPDKSQTTVVQSGVLQPQSAASQNPYDLSVLLIAQTLNLDLVYLLALDQSSNGGITTRVVSSHGLATDPVFDAGLHGRALRSKSGLLYVHPDPDSELAREMGTYISGMLVPVLQLSGGGGYVLAAFTKEKSQIFVAEDLKFLRDFGISLMKWLLAADAKELESSHNAVEA